MPDGVILGFDLSLLINIGIQWLNILLLSFALYRLLYKPVKGYMDARAERIKKTLSDAENEREEAKSLRMDYDTMISEIEAERDEILHTSHKKAMENSDKLLFKARSEAEEIHRRAVEDVERMKKRESDEIKRNLIEISTMMAARFVEVSVSPEDHERFIREAVSNLEIS